MKLWTTIEFERLPGMLQNGMGNPYAGEIHCSVDAEHIAERVLDDPDTGEAFLELNIPDAELDKYLTVCMESHYLDIQQGMVDTLEDMIGEGAPEEEVKALRSQIRKAERAADSGSATRLIKAFGYACFYADTVIPPAYIKVLDPATMLEALNTARETENPEVLEQAIETTEARGLESLGASFWVWLLLFIQGLAQGRIITPESIREAAEAAEAREARKKAQRKRRRKKSGGKWRKKASKEAAGEATSGA